MKIRLILLVSLLLIGLSAFGQITANDGTCYAATTSCTFGGTATGSLKIVFAFDNGTRTAPSLPGSGWTTIANGTTTTNGVVAGYRIGCNKSSSGSDTGSGTWTNATAVAGISYPNTAVGTTANCNTTGIGIKIAANAKASTTVTYDVLTSMRGNASSWVAGFMGDSASSLCLPATVLTNSVVATGTMQIGDTNGVVASFSAKTCTVSSSTWMSYSLEVLASTIPTPTMSPDGGSFTNDTVTTFSDGTSGVTFCSTLNGSAPSVVTSGSCAGGTAGGTATVIATATSVKVVATKAGLNESALKTSASPFTLTVANPTFGTNGGSFNNDTSSTQSSTTTSAVFCQTVDGVTSPAASTPGTCSVGTTGASATVIATGTTIKALGTKANYVNSAVQTSSAFTLTVGAVTDSPGAGTYTSAQTATLGITTTTGATPYYTIDNTTASCSSTAYSSGISVGSTEHVRAVGCKTNYVTAAEINDLYTINLPSSGLNLLTLLGVGGGAISGGGAATFTHIQGGTDTAHSAVGSTSCDPYPPADMTAGNLIVVSLIFWNAGSTVPTSISVQDGNSNVLVETTNSPSTATDGTYHEEAYVYSEVYSGAGHNHLTISWTNTVRVDCYAEEFHRSTGSWTFDKDVAETIQTCSGTSAALPSLTPAVGGSLLYSAGIDNDNALTNPAAGATQGVWTGSTSGPETANLGANAEYDLSATGATAVNYTCGATSDAYTAISAAWN